MSNFDIIVASASALNKPVISPSSQHNKGVMLTYGVSKNMIGKQASRMTDKLLKGISPSVIPIETAEFFIGLNVKTAKKIGVSIPTHILNQAEFIVR